VSSTRSNAATPEAERDEEQRSLKQQPDRSRRHAASSQRLASARTLKKRASSAMLMKKPTSERKIEPVANGVKCTSRERFTASASNGSDSIQPKWSMIHSSRNRLSDSNAAMT